MDFENEYTFRYNMQFAHRGTAIIINNRNFESKTGMNERSGTDVDAAQLYKIFKLLEFNVQMHNNLTCTGMLKTISEGLFYLDVYFLLLWDTYILAFNVYINTLFTKKDIAI